MLAPFIQLGFASGAAITGGTIGSIEANVYTNAETSANVRLLHVGNDNLFTVDVVRNTADDYINDATVTLTLQDADGDDVAGISWPLTLTYVASSDGKYQCVVDSAATLTSGHYYTAVVEIDDGNGLTATINQVCRARRRVN